jgi:hypothetical protein
MWEKLSPIASYKTRLSYSVTKNSKAQTRHKGPVMWPHVAILSVQCAADVFARPENPRRLTPSLYALNYISVLHHHNLANLMKLELTAPHQKNHGKGIIFGIREGN